MSKLKKWILEALRDGEVTREQAERLLGKSQRDKNKDDEYRSNRTGTHNQPEEFNGDGWDDRCSGRRELVDNWLLENDCVNGERVLIKHWW